MTKKLVLTKHASERLLERKIPLKAIERMVRKCVRVEDRETGAILCIYKESPSRYYTLILDEAPDQTTIITTYESGKWQIEQYRKVKKNES